MNFHEFTEIVAQLEGKKVSLNIAQVKEVISITFKTLRKMPLEDVLDILKYDPEKEVNK